MKGSRLDEWMRREENKDGIKASYDEKTGE